MNITELRFMVGTRPTAALLLSALLAIVQVSEWAGGESKSIDALTTYLPPPAAILQALPPAGFIFLRQNGYSNFFFFSDSSGIRKLYLPSEIHLLLMYFFFKYKKIKW